MNPVFKILVRTLIAYDAIVSSLRLPFLHKTNYCCVQIYAQRSVKSSILLKQFQFLSTPLQAVLCTMVFFSDGRFLN